MNSHSIVVNKKTLFYKGNINLLNTNIIAVIGKRDVSQDVLETAYYYGQVVASNTTILNGLALGCDTFAIKGALSVGGKVIAVLPCGIDMVYPKANEELYEDILDNDGLLISQYPGTTPITKYQFVERDKLQALLSNKVISIYANSNGGTIQTLTYAKKLGKEIACISGSLGNDLFLSKKFAKELNINNLTTFITESYEQMSLLLEN